MKWSYEKSQTLSVSVNTSSHLDVEYFLYLQHDPNENCIRFSFESLNWDFFFCWRKGIEKPFSQNFHPFQ